jgi:hypothetical protein
MTGRGTLPRVEASSVADLVARALAAYDGLAEVAEAVEDEWSYVTDLRAAWSARLQAVAAARPTEPAGPAAVAAVDALAAEVGRISDPHRAIDWLSTFPQVVLLGLGEAP